MNWEAFAPLFTELLQRFGEKAFDMAKQILAKANSPDPLAPKDIDDLQAAGRSTGASLFLDRLKAAGIDPASDQGKLFLSLVQ